MKKIVSIPVAVGLLLAAALAFFLGALFVDQAAKDTQRMIGERHGIVQAMALAEVVSRVESEGVDVEDRLATVVEHRAQLKVKGIRIIRLSGARLLASSMPGDKATPRRLKKDEKWLFDLGQRLRIARETNRDEGIARKKEIELEYQPGEGMSVSAPYLVDGTVHGYVQLQLPQQVPASMASRGLAIIGAALVIGVFFILAIPLGHFGLFRPDEQGLSRGQLALAAGVLLLGLWIFAVTQISSLADHRWELEEGLAKHFTQLRAATMDISRSFGFKPAPFTKNLWDVDDYRRPLGISDARGHLMLKALVAVQTVQFEEMRRSLDGVGLLALAVLLFCGAGWATRLKDTLVEHREAYLYVSPAIIGMLILVFYPFLYGIVLSFTDATIYNTGAPLKELWIGFTNYLNILADIHVFARSGQGWIVNYQNFYWTLFITVAWTVVNVSIGVSVGLLLALILNTKGLKMRAVYRVLLILPWAIPNYITALIWRGMFHKQFGVINQVIQMFGGEPVAWFDGVFSSFITGIATNGWLSFPFMMVMCLGGLQSISQEMYEAARLDGAGRWHQFRYITLPSLKPVLVPAIIISVVWTFNMFNIIYLVSGGEPAGSNEILITQAYKIAFEQYRYGYAAAYSTIIFVILLAYGIFQIKMTRATEANI